MTLTHHPSEALLIGYAAGSTSEAEALAIGTHLTFCAECRARAGLAESMGGYLLEQVEEARVAESALDAVLARLDETTPVAEPAPSATEFAEMPAILAQYADEALAKTGWKPLVPGIRQLPLETNGRSKARLLKLKPGTALPEHGHGGLELTIVLTGSYSDALGQFKRGDIAEVDGTIVHRPVVDQGSECIALVVSESPLQFKSWTARLAQRFIGI